jgi:hypothetical protein
VLKPVGWAFLQQNKEKIQLNRVFKGEFSYVKIFNKNLGKKKILSFDLSEKGKFVHLTISTSIHQTPLVLTKWGLQAARI